MKDLIRRRLWIKDEDWILTRIERNTESISKFNNRLKSVENIEKVKLEDDYLLVSDTRAICIEPKWDKEGVRFTTYNEILCVNGNYYGFTVPYFYPNTVVWWTWEHITDKKQIRYFDELFK